MKRAIALGCLLCLCAGFALASDAPQTREATFYLEGMPETVVLTAYDAGQGYTLWYDAGMFAPEAMEAGSEDLVLVPVSEDALAGISFLLRPLETQDLTLDDAAQKEVDAWMADDYEMVHWQETDVEPFINYPHRQFTLRREDAMMDVYLLEADTQRYAFYAEYPAEAAEGMGPRMRLMVVNFEEGSPAAE